MRPALRLLARVGQGRFLEGGAPTGLTGLLTSHTPRPHLVYLYSATLDKLKALPESSVYRQSTEALTRRRLELVRNAVPEGYEEWKQRAGKQIEQDGEKIVASAGEIRVMGDNAYILDTAEDMEADTPAWEGEESEAQAEGPRHESERNDNQKNAIAGETPRVPDHIVKLEAEPALTAQQISALENQIGAGLIEEVIAVAEGELKLVDSMAKNAVWDDLEEQAPEGQWTYFERDTHLHKP